MTAFAENPDKILVNREMNMAVALKQNELRDLLVPLIMNAGPTVNGRLCVTLDAGDRDRGDVGRHLMPEPIQDLRRSQMERVEAGAANRRSDRVAFLRVGQNNQLCRTSQLPGFLNERRVGSPRRTRSRRQGLRRQDARWSGKRGCRWRRTGNPGGPKQD